MNTSVAFHDGGNGTKEKRGGLVEPGAKGKLAPIDAAILDRVAIVIKESIFYDEKDFNVISKKDCMNRQRVARYLMHRRDSDCS